jgi:hypothetical protein
MGLDSFASSSEAVSEPPIEQHFYRLSFQLYL